MACQSFSFSEGDPDHEKIRAFMGPGQIDASVRQTLQMLWMIMPPDRRNVDAVEQEFRRVVDRALRDLREDAERLGQGEA